MKRFLQSGAVSLIWMMVAGCSEPAAPTSQLQAPAPVTEPLQILAINAPLAYFAERLGDALVAVDVLVPGEEDPAFWQPAAADVIAMQKADLILLNGAGYEPWLSQVSLPERRLLISADAVLDSLIESETVTHQHGPEGAHSHAETAFTLWLDPLLALEQARSVAVALAAARPDSAEAIEARMAVLETELLALHTDWQQVTAELGSAPLLFSHPVYQYFERRYGLNSRSLHWEPDEDPGEGGWSDLEKLLESHPARLLLWEAEPLPETRSRLLELGILSVTLSPAARADARSEFLKRQRANVAQLREALPRLR